MDASERGRLLNKLADLIERDRAYLAVSTFRQESNRTNIEQISASIKHFGGLIHCSMLYDAVSSFHMSDSLCKLLFTFRHFTYVQYTQTESNRLKAKTIRVSSRITDFRLTGSPFSGT